VTTKTTIELDYSEFILKLDHFCFDFSFFLSLNEFIWFVASRCKCLHSPVLCVWFIDGTKLHQDSIIQFVNRRIWDSYRESRQRENQGNWAPKRNREEQIGERLEDSQQNNIMNWENLVMTRHSRQQAHPEISLWRYRRSKRSWLRVLSVIWTGNGLNV
jgi:hypothetical protein